MGGGWEGGESGLGRIGPVMAGLWPSVPLSFPFGRALVDGPGSCSALLGWALALAFSSFSLRFSSFFFSMEFIYLFPGRSLLRFTARGLKGYNPVILKALVMVSVLARASSRAGHVTAEEDQLDAKFCTKLGNCQSEVTRKSINE